MKGAPWGFFHGCDRWAPAAELEPRPAGSTQRWWPRGERGSGAPLERWSVLRVSGDVFPVAQ